MKIEIHSVSMLTPMYVQFSEGGSEKRSVLVFYDNDTGKVVFGDKTEAANTDQIESAIAEYCAGPVEQTEFSIPGQIMENIIQARTGDGSFFGLTPDLRSWSSENKEQEQ